MSRQTPPTHTAAWRAAEALLGTATLLAACGGSDGSTPSPGPDSPTVLADHRLVFDSDRPGNHEIFVMNTDGTGVLQLTRDASYENWWPRVSPDRTRLLFYRSPKGIPEKYLEASLWTMAVNGTGLTELRAKGTDGWTRQGHAEWSPDGTRIAMFGGTGTDLEIFVTDAQGRHPQQFTDRGGVNTDVSWSPDGTRLLFNGCPGTPCLPADYEIYVMPATPMATPTRLTFNTVADYDPYYSPDGSRLAWLQNVDPTKYPITPGLAMGAWAIRIADADAGNASDLINDGNVNSKPSWSRDGRTIYFHRLELSPLVDIRYGVFRIGSDKTGLTRLTAVGDGNNEHPSN